MEADGLKWNGTGLNGRGCVEMKGTGFNGR